MSQRGRVALAAAGMLLLFGAAVAVLLRVMPGPRSHTFYLVVGCLSVLVSLAVTFLMLMAWSLKGGGDFSKRRRR